MFWSKIWFFLVAIAAATAMAIALSFPRPAERATIATEAVRLQRACGVANILLSQNARDRIDLAANFARADAPAGTPRLKLDSILFNASKGDIVSDDAHATARSALSYLLDSIQGKKPDFVIAVNQNGQVVARAGIEEREFGDSMVGYHAVDDALDGYLRDDLWHLNGKLYRVAVSPVIERRDNAYAGAVILGHEFDQELASRLAENIGAQIAFYAQGDAVASSATVQLHKEVAEAYEQWRAQQADMSSGDAASDCVNNAPIAASAGGETYDVVFARLPGEASGVGAFYAVFTEQPDGLGFMGTLEQLTSDDMSFGNFPWIQMGLLFVLTVGIGIGLMVFESDRPLRKLVKDAVALAQGEKLRLEEMEHKGKHGSVARSVNIALDKLERDAKSAKRDLDSLLGPAPEQRATPVPSVGPAGPAPGDFQPPPPSEFKFRDNAGGTSGSGRGPTAKPTPPPMPNKPTPAFDLDLPPPPPAMGAPAAAPAPPHVPVNEQVPPPPVSLPGGSPVHTPPPVPGGGPDAIDDDILAGSERAPAQKAPPVPRGESDFDAPTRVADPSMQLIQQSADDDTLESPPMQTDNGEFRRVFDEFTALKQQCGENVDTLTYEKFANKLRKNRQALMDKHGCKSVKFQVYIKDGKAALKATPVKS